MYSPPEISEHPVFHRWSAEVLVQLRAGSRRFNVLMAGIPGVSDRILTERLRELVDADLVSRQVLAGPPVQVFYGLTPTGRRFLEPVEELAALQTEPALQEAAVG